MGAVTASDIARTGKELLHNRLKDCPGHGEGIMEKKMETTIVYWGNIRIMEAKMETTIMGLGLLSKAFIGAQSTVVQKVARFASQTNVPCSACVHNCNVRNVRTSWKPHKFLLYWKRLL